MKTTRWPKKGKAVITALVSGLVSCITILVSLILVILQFADIIHLQTDEILCLIMALLTIMSGALFSERFGTLREIQENLEKLIKQKSGQGH
jgi:hypothetical protein